MIQFYNDTAIATSDYDTTFCLFASGIFFNKD